MIFDISAFDACPIFSFSFCTISSSSGVDSGPFAGTMATYSAVREQSPGFSGDRTTSFVNERGRKVSSKSIHTVADEENRLTKFSALCARRSAIFPP